jgi:hypothetical protein
MIKGGRGRILLRDPPIGLQGLVIALEIVKGCSKGKKDVRIVRGEGQRP